MKQFSPIQIIRNKIITRKLSGKGTLFVEKGERVTPADVLGEYKHSAGFHVINTALQLNVAPDKAIHYITRKQGQRIYKGEIVAEKKHVLGETDRVFASIDGLIDHINEHTGQIMIKIAKKTENTLAGVWGKVQEVRNDTEIDIETQVTQVQGKSGRGYEREGLIKIIASPYESIKESMIKDEHAGKILVGGSIASKAILAKAINKGVNGIIIGGIDYQDLISIGAESDIGITIVALEGFGMLPINLDLYSQLMKFENYYGFIDGQQSTLIIPLDTVTKEITKKTKDKVLKIRTKARILFDRHIGEVGVVTELIDEYKYKSGISAPSVKIAYNNTEYIVPQNNIEIID